MTISAAIVDDEPYARTTLRSLLQRYCPEITIVAEADSVESAKEVAMGADLVFLDIEMSDGTGFDLLQQMTTIPFEVIFVTAYDNYAIQAIKASAVDYLLKPVDVAELQKAVRNAVERRTAKAAQLRSNQADLPNQSQRLVLPNLDGFVITYLRDIIRCQSEGSYTRFFLKNGKSILVSKHLGEYEADLTGHGFFRIHHSHMINLLSIRAYRKGKGGTVVMNDGSEVPVSVRRKTEFLDVVMGRQELG